MAALTLHRYPFKAMGTACELQLYAAAAAAATAAAQAVTSDVQRLEAKYSRYRDDSLLTQINAVAARGGSITVDTETAYLLEYADTCYHESGGLFDLSSGILRRAWDFRSGMLPTPDAVAALLDKTGWQRLRWQAPRLEFPHAGMELDLGGVVKEYAADRAATLCQDLGITQGFINLGGDIRIVGPHPDGSPWRIGIRDPRHPEQTLHTLELFSGALASSGNYERCITLGDKRYSHLLNPLDGWPVRHMAAVSVCAEFCVVAGSASTIGMLKDSQGKQWLADLGLPHLWVDVDGHVGGDLVYGSQSAVAL